MTKGKPSLIAAVLLTVAAVVVAAAPARPKRVLIIHSYLPAYESGMGDKLRGELDRQLLGQVDLYENWLASAPLTSQGEDANFANYLTTAFSNRPLDLVIGMGTPAANFLQRNAKTLFPSVPEVLTVVEERQVALFGLRDNQVAIAYSRGQQTTVGEILRLLPRTKNLAVFMGNSPVERYFADQLRAAAKPLSGRVTVTSLSGLPTFDDVLQRAATLPPQSVIYFEPFFSDMQGMPSDELVALAKLHAGANAPIFSVEGYHFGHGIVGGSMLMYDDYARQTVSVAIRVLKGERPSAIKLRPIRLQSPRFDSRELIRWGIKEANLPPGSKVEFRELTIWEQYSMVIAGAAGLILLQSALILGLLYERRLRRNAQLEAARRLLELARITRRSAVGELSASIAHELSQPLAAIVTNAEAAELTSPPEGLKEILAEVKNDALRATEVLRRVRGMLANAPAEVREIDLNAVVKDTLGLLSTQAAAGGVALSSDLNPHGPRVTGDRIQVQQVILNLVLNAIDALAGAETRYVVVRTAMGDNWAETVVEDSGPGVPDDRLERIFEPFFTTKKAGMGMGLSIARTIAASLGGTIHAENRRGGGAMFRLRLPLARPKREAVDRANK